MTRGGPRGSAAPAVLLAVAIVVLAGGTAAPAARETAQTPSSSLRSDVARLLAGRATADPRLARLVPGHRRGELAYFVVLDVPKTAVHRTALERAGARILREYRALDAFAAVSRPQAVRRVASLPGVSRLVPVEVIETEAETEVDQTRATTADVGARR